MTFLRTLQEWIDRCWVQSVPSCIACTHFIWHTNEWHRMRDCRQILLSWHLRLMTDIVGVSEYFQGSRNHLVMIRRYSSRRHCWMHLLQCYHRDHRIVVFRESKLSLCAFLRTHPRVNNKHVKTETVINAAMSYLRNFICKISFVGSTVSIILVSNIFTQLSIPSKLFP